MHASKHEILNTEGLRTIVQGIAVRAGCSVDELVHVAHGRPVRPDLEVSQGARAGLAMLDKDTRAKLAALEWPFECPKCRGQVPALALCPVCKTSACADCEAPGKCSSCRAIEKAKKDDAAASEAAKKAARG